MKNKQSTLLLAVFLSISAPVFADSIPAHLEGMGKHFALAEGFTEQRDFQGSFARHNTLLSSVEEDGARTIAISGALYEFLFYQGVSSEGEKVRIHGDFGNGNGNSNGNGGNVPLPAVSVAEPGSQTLLLFGLTGLGMFFYPRNYLRDAIKEQA